MFQKIIFAITIVLCLGLISCTETNKPIDPVYNEPIVINDDTYHSGDVASGVVFMPDVTIASDLIVVTEVNKVENSKAYLTITETLYGSTNEKEIQFNSNCFSFSKNEKYILFLHKNGNSYGLTTRVVSGNWYPIHPSMLLINFPWVEESCKDDIKLIMSAYNNNKELLSNKQALFQLYPQLNSWFVKYEILIDIWNIKSELNKQDLPVLIEWQQRETELNPPTNIVDDLLNILINILKGEEE
jgi:hypothetical protein